VDERAAECASEVVELLRKDHRDSRALIRLLRH